MWINYYFSKEEAILKHVLEKDSFDLKDFADNLCFVSI